MTTTRAQARQSNVSHHAAWRAADKAGSELQRFVKGGRALTVHALRTAATDRWEMRVQIYERGVKVIEFPTEPYEVFPSETLKTQIMLVAG